jgi:hypothetical protein
VQNPHAGLFDAATAQRWIEALGRRAAKPFRVHCRPTARE